MDDRRRDSLEHPALSLCQIGDEAGRSARGVEPRTGMPVYYSQGVTMTDCRPRQALGQCNNFLTTRMPSAARIKTTSTSAAVKLISSDEKYRYSAAIGPEVCGTLFPGIDLLHIGIQDEDGESEFILPFLSSILIYIIASQRTSRNFSSSPKTHPPTCRQSSLSSPTANPFQIAA